MKVVQELVTYFDRRGELSPKQLRALLDQGFLAAEAPPNMLELCHDIGANYYFRVRGDTEGQAWGSGPYTGDSSLSLAARGGEGHGGRSAREVSGQHPQQREDARFRALRDGVQALVDLNKKRPLLSGRFRFKETALSCRRRCCA